MKLRLAKKLLRFDPRNTGKHFDVPVIGEVYLDCDGFNYRLARGSYYQTPASQFKNRTRGWILSGFEYVKENGSLFCGCTKVLLTKGVSISEIETYQRQLHSETAIESMKKAGWWNEETEELYTYMISGGSICDEIGSPSKELIQIRNKHRERRNKDDVCMGAIELIEDVEE